MPTDLEVLNRLRLALDSLAFALELGDAEAILEAESPLRSAINALRAADLNEIASQPDVRAAVLNVQLALSRCRALGGSMAVLSSVLSGPGYGPAGQRLRPTAPSPRFASQV